ncbi:alpha/beta hydrolase [Bacillus cytotoxicus]|uniref:alpha/beta hydrolase n=1 Tax=Bacillus cytotoxicus TaxID=580165 RepID=UPI003D7F14B1
MLFSKLIDLCALYDLHKKRSKEYQFSGGAEMDFEDINEFYKVDQSIDIQFYNEVSDLQKYEIAKFEYQSLIESGNPFNDLVSGEAYLNKNEDAPNVIFVHGWRMDSNERVKKIFHEKMIDLDWNLYYFTLPYHFAREPEIDVLTSVFYANRLSYSIWNTNPGKYIKKDLSVHGVTYEELVESWEITEPSQATPIMNQENILLISAKYDQYVHMKDTSYLWEAWNKPMRYIYNCGHAGIVLKRKQIALDTIGFIRKRIFENE